MCVAIVIRVCYYITILLVLPNMEVHHYHSLIKFHGVHARVRVSVSVNRLDGPPTTILHTEQPIRRHNPSTLLLRNKTTIRPPIGRDDGQPEISGAI